MHGATGANDQPTQTHINLYISQPFSRDPALGTSMSSACQILREQAHSLNLLQEDQPMMQNVSWRAVCRDASRRCTVQPSVAASGSASQRLNYRGLTEAGAFCALLSSSLQLLTSLPCFLRFKLLPQILELLCCAIYGYDTMLAKMLAANSAAPLGHLEEEV